MKRTNKIIMLLAVLVAGSMIVGAALVNYLSNEVKAEIEVSSPMVASISEGQESWGGESFPEDDDDSPLWENTITIPGIHGGETITLYTMSANEADANITGFEKAIVTNWAGVTSADFVSVVVRVDSIYGDLGYGTEHDLIALGAGVGYEEIDEYHIRFGTAGNSLWGIGETDVTEIVVTFKDNAFGTYTFTYRVVPAH